jgi:coniferyl-aldehyde dehydrogenase
MDLRASFALQRQAFMKNPYPGVRERRDHLHRLRKALLRRQEDLARAIDADFGGRSRTEVLYSEVFVSIHAIRNAVDHLDDWMQERPVPVDWPLQPARAYVIPQPVGVVGVISSWNYPIFVSLAPIAGALAAGNRVMLKPSEFTPRTSALLAELFSETFSTDHVTVVQGDAEVGKAFASLPFDHLIFTGSTAVGRQIMRAAAENLTPVTLELGGKSPAIVADDARFSRAAADIVYGKFLNAGQTCIAPDYVLVPKSLRDKFVAHLREAVAKQYPNAGSNADYTSIINERQHDRLQGYLAEARAAGVEVVELGGPSTGRKMVPALVLDPPDELRLMQDEIFGPILPVKSYAEIDEAIEYVNARPRPLALYLFASSERLIDRVLKNTVAGGVCVNDTLVQIVAENLPFGGAGASGFGAYHGQTGFDTFSKLKPVFRRQGIGLGVSLRPPYGKIHEWMRRILIR